MEKISIDGSDVADLAQLIAAIVRCIAPDDPGAYFGWDLHSFGDCLRGGWLGVPPCEIEVRNAEHMVESFDHKGSAAYYEHMLEVIDQGGRGFAKEEARDSYAAYLAAAIAGEGPTLLDEVLTVVRGSRASLRLFSSSGRLLAEAIGEL